MPSSAEKAKNPGLMGGYKLPDKDLKRVGNDRLPTAEIHDHSVVKKPAVWKTGPTG